jgi:hypothetical protein
MMAMAVAAAASAKQPCARGRESDELMPGAAGPRGYKYGVGVPAYAAWAGVRISLRVTFGSERASQPASNTRVGWGV